MKLMTIRKFWPILFFSILLAHADDHATTPDKPILKGGWVRTEHRGWVTERDEVNLETMDESQLMNLAEDAFGVEVEFAGNTKEEQRIPLLKAAIRKGIILEGSGVKTIYLRNGDMRDIDYGGSIYADPEDPHFAAFLSRQRKVDLASKRKIVDDLVKIAKEKTKIDVRVSAGSIEDDISSLNKFVSKAPDLSHSRLKEVIVTSDFTSDMRDHNIYISPFDPKFEEILKSYQY
jgi:hypothetical protein